MCIEKIFFELLQVAVGNRKSLSRVPSATEWALLFDMSKKQALVAIAFAGSVSFATITITAIRMAP